MVHFPKNYFYYYHKPHSAQKYTIQHFFSINLKQKISIYYETMNVLKLYFIKIILKKFPYKHQFILFPPHCLSLWLLCKTVTVKLIRKEGVLTIINVCLSTPQSWAKYLTQTLVIMWNYALREMFNFCFFRSFLLFLTKFSF